MNLLAALKKVIGPQLRFVSCAWESVLDARRYSAAVNHHSLVSDNLAAHLERDIVCCYHVIEKGLSMPEFRSRFGIPMVQRLLQLIDRWDRACAAEQPNNQVETAKAVLRAYAERHAGLGINVDDVIRPSAKESPLPNQVVGGAVPSGTVTAGDREAFNRLLLTRRSVRNFIRDRKPSREVLRSAVEAAVRTPSVCNRQTWRIHVFEGDIVDQIMEIQGGNRGFGHTIPIALVVTSDMRYFSGKGERYQSWIDGGMFSMTLLLALHAEGLGAVALNWAATNQRDRNLREVATIPGHERIIMIIGCGYPTPDALSPASQRRDVDSIVSFH